LRGRRLLAVFADSLTAFARKLVAGLLNLRLFLHRLHTRLEKDRIFGANSKTDGLTANEIKASLEISFAKSLSDWLKEKLKRYPYWAAGHLALARESLTLNEIATCYASCQACQVLQKKGALYHEARKVLGVCYLRSAVADKAIKILAEEVRAAKKDYLLIEELASAYLLANRRDEARAALSSVPPGKLTPQGVAALSYLKKSD
jgi:hypothetical protein